MTPKEIRLKCLDMAKPNVSSPDLGLWIEKAARLEAWINDAGQAEAPPQTSKTLTLPPKSGQPNGPAHRQK